MSKKNFDYKRKMQAKKVSRSSKMRKVFASSAAASLLAFNTLPAVAGASTAGEALTNPKIASSSAILNIAPYASLAEVRLLTDINIDANLTDSEDPNYYNLNLGLTGTGLADVELISPDRTVVFYAPDLAGQLEHSGGTASVSVDILPITMGDLPALDGALEGLQGTLTGLVTGLISGINDALPALIPPSLVEINGLDELNAAIDNLNNLNDALADVLAYSDDVEYTVDNENGTIAVTFSDGLGNHLETAVVDVVQSALDDVSNAVNNLEINILSDLPIVGDLLNSLTNDLLLPLVGNVTEEVTNLATELTDGTIDLSNDLASAQVIGNTSVNLDVLVNKPAGVNGEVVIEGAGVQDSVIDAALLESLEDSTTVTFDEDDESDSDSDSDSDS
ncbi:adhesive domain-containing protein, partial [Oceanobacillus sojae]|uniref:adhesive domain-containing protein n=1 Tax=Oceanobacillus sojae TaxID=582851 RepID=UPI003530818B